MSRDKPAPEPQSPFRAAVLDGSGRREGGSRRVGARGLFPPADPRVWSGLGPVLARGSSRRERRGEVRVEN